MSDPGAGLSDAFFVIEIVSATATMSEFQYYEFQAIDRPLSAADQQALRNISTRARITAASFTNTYEWGDLKGDPAELVRRWFDLHFYLANSGQRRLMIKLPARLIERWRLDGFLAEVDCVSINVSGESLILDIQSEDREPDDEWDDGSGWLAALTPLRADVLAGDLRLFYLLWLTAVEADAFEPETPEPLPGIGPMTGALESFARLFQIDADLVAAAAEHSAGPMSGKPIPAEVVQPIIATMPDKDKIGMLTRLFEGDAHVAHELRAQVRHRLTQETGPAVAAVRTVGELRSRAQAIRVAREQADADKAAAEQKRRAQEAEKSRRIRLDAVARRGEGVWREIEGEIERRNSSGYDRAASLLLDLRAIAEESNTLKDFARRLQTLRERHARKERFLERLTKLG